MNFKDKCCRERVKRYNRDMKYDSMTHNDDRLDEKIRERFRRDAYSTGREKEENMGVAHKV